MSQPNVAEYDPITFQVLWSRLISAADEMAVALVRTAFSPVVSDGHDYACAVYDEHGEMLAQSTHCTPGLIGSMPVFMKTIMDEFDSSEFADGDVFICNDPWIGAGHTPDIYIASPIFVHSRLVGFAVNAAHHIDVGGRMYSPDSKSVYEEGLIIPPTKLVSAGVWNEDLVRLISRNVRLPDKVLGDLRAQIAANHVGARRVAQLLDDRGLTSLTALGGQIIEHSRKSMAEAISRAPDGTYHHIDTLEEHDASRTPVQIETTVSIAGDQIAADFSGSSAQVDRPINCVLNFTKAYAIFALKSSLHPHLPNNAGVFNAVSIHAPEGSILNPTYPAPVMLRTSLVYYAIEGMYGALAEAMPDHVLAPSGTYPLWIPIFSGYDDLGNPFVYIFWGNGGQGAASTRDGRSAVVFPSNTSNTPAEILEANTTLRIESKEFIPDSGGVGAFRGGVGQRIRISNGGERDVLVSAIGGRYLQGAPGLHGGGVGRPGRIQVDGHDPLTHDESIELKPGELLTFEFPGGGGFGEALRRRPEDVERDVRLGLVTAECAREDYGVVIGADGIVDHQATAATRQIN